VNLYVALASSRNALEGHALSARLWRRSRHAVTSNFPSPPPLQAGDILVAGHHDNKTSNPVFDDALALIGTIYIKIILFHTIERLSMMLLVVVQ